MTIVSTGPGHHLLIISPTQRNPMKQLAAFLVPVLALLGTNSTAQYTPPDGTGLEGIIVETYYVADENDHADTDGASVPVPVGAVTYRVFADLKEGYELLTAGGFVNHPFTIGTTTTFWNNEDRGDAWGDAINDIHLNKNTVAIDSWLAMGAASDAHWGVLKVEDPNGSVVGGTNNDGGSTGAPLLVNAAAAVGIALTEADGLSNVSVPPGTTYVGDAPEFFNVNAAVNTYSNDNFAWAVLGGVSSPLPGNKVLLGQFTTEGILSFCMNLWVRIPDSLVCNDPNCHTVEEYYAVLLESDTSGAGFAGDNKFTLPSLCFTGAVENDCLGVPGGAAVPGTACDDANILTANDTWSADCLCTGQPVDCQGVPNGTALPGTACDDNDPNTGNDTWLSDCTCQGSTGLRELPAPVLEVGPNPTRDLLFVRLSGAATGTIMLRLLDLSGAVVLQREVRGATALWSGSLDLSALSSGAYLLDVGLPGAVLKQRVLKF